MDKKVEFLTEEELEKMSLIELVAYKNLLRILDENSKKGGGATND